MLPNVQQPDDALATVLVTPRERFSLAVQSLHSVIEHTQAPFELIYIDAGSPARVAQELRSLCEANGFHYVRVEGFLSSNAARNMGQRLVTTRYTAFIENDVMVSDGWLQTLVETAQETGAEVVAPLICQNFPLHSEIHHGLGTFAHDHHAFFERPPEERRIYETHPLQGEKVEGAGFTREETQACEFHCVLVDRRTFERFGALDEQMLATKEHLDFCMTVWSGGGRVIFEPASVVTYIFPNRASPLEPSDWPFFALRWSPRWQRQSIDHFFKKWSIQDEAYLAERNDIYHWRHEQGIAKPITNRIPLVARSYRVKTAVTKVVTKLVQFWSDRLVARYSPSKTTLRPTETVSAIRPANRADNAAMSQAA